MSDPNPHASDPPPAPPTAPGGSPPNHGPTLYCPQCGYDLTTREDQGVCPECGAAFDARELRRTGGLPRIRVWPMLLALIAPPVVLVVALLVCLMVGGNLDVAVFILLALGAMAGVATSIWSARMIARRLARRPPKSMPDVNSVTLTVVFAIVFFGAQACVAGVLFFVGCTAVVIAGFTN